MCITAFKVWQPPPVRNKGLAPAESPEIRFKKTDELSCILSFCLILLNYSQGFRQIIFSAKRPVKTKQMWRFRRIFILPLNICRSFQPRPGPNSMRHFDFYSIHIFNNVGSDQNKHWCWHVFFIANVNIALLRTKTPKDELRCIMSD